MHASFQIQPVPKNPIKENCPMISWPSSLCSAPDITEVASIKYCRKIRIYPTTTQKKLFETCFRATRYMWNNALEYIQKNPTTKLDHLSLRNNTMLSNEQLDLEGYKHQRWLTDVPYDTRDLVLKQLASNFRTNFTLLRNGNIKHFEMKFKTRKNPYQIFFVKKTALDLGSQQIFKRKLKNEVFRVRAKMKKWINQNPLVECDSIIRRELNRYYICLPKKLTKDRPTHIPIYTKVALDPGVRTFQTFYSDQGIAGKLGHSICETLIDLGVKEDKLKRILSTTRKKRTRYNLRKRCFLLRTKIKNIVRDLHWKACNYLCSNFKHILLPTYDTSKMVPKRARNIGSITVRKMLTLSPYAFKERLLYMGKKMNVYVEIVNEAYTTMTCGGCGELKAGLKGSKVYNCLSCGFQIDRDYNAARNIFLKYI